MRPCPAERAPSPIISGDAVASRRHKKWRKVVLTLGLLSAAGAAVAALMKKSAPKDDPWATPLEDPYVAPSSGRHSKLESVDTVDPADEAGATDKGKPLPAAATDDGGSEILESMDEDGLPDPLAPTSEVETPPKNVKDKGKGKSE